MALACSRDDEVVSSAPSASASAAKPVDHLAPGELAPGKVRVHGMPVPRGMKVARRFDDSTELEGRVSPDKVAEYVRDYVVASHVEVAGDKRVFPAARFRGGNDETFRLEIFHDPPITRLSIERVTKPKATEGLTNEERWKRAGLKPGGALLDPKTVE